VDERDRVADARIARLPDFELPATCGTLSGRTLRKAPAVLYFYPKDATTGCTLQAGEFRDLASEFAAAGIRVVGVSRDSLSSHERFRERQQLSFDLVADVDEVLCAMFDVIRDKHMYGRQVRGIQRSTFLFDGAGKLCRSWRGVKVPAHASIVLEAARALSVPAPP